MEMNYKRTIKKTQWDGNKRLDPIILRHLTKTITTTHTVGIYDEKDLQKISRVL